MPPLPENVLNMDAPAILPGAAGTAAAPGPLGRSFGALLRRLGIAADGAALVALGVLLLALAQASGVLVANVAETLFVKRVGAEWLPPLYLARGLLLVLVLGYVGVALDRGRRFETTRWLLLAGAALPIALRALLLLNDGLAYWLTMLGAELVAFPLVGAVWSILPDLAPDGHSRRAASTLVALGLLGEAVGSALSVPLAHALGIENVLLAAAACAAAGGLVLSQLRHRTLVRLDVARPPKLPLPGARAAAKLVAGQAREAIDLGRRSGLFRFLVGATAVGAALAPFVDLQFQLGATRAFAGELDLFAFYGVLKSLLALGAVAIQLLAFGWLRHEAGIARTLLVLPLGAAAALAVLWVSGGVAGYALVWAMLRLGGSSIDEPARRYLYDLFPVELRERVDWLVNRGGRTLAAALGSVLLLPVFYLGGTTGAAAAVAVGVALWLAVVALFRARYGRLVLATSLMNRVDFDQLRPGDVSGFLDRGALRQLERELVSGVPARAQLAVELLRQVSDARLPVILAASYMRQPPVLRALVLDTIQGCMRDTPPGHPSAAPTIAAVARLVRSRLPDRERAALIRIYAQAIADQGLEPKDAIELLDRADPGGAVSVELALAAARARLRPDAAAARALAAALERALHAADEADVHLAIDEIADLVRADPRGNAALLAHYTLVLDARTGWSPRVRAHVIASATRLAEATGDAFPRIDFDGRVVPLAHDRDPRVVAAALDYLQAERFVGLLETHVLPCLTAGNHHVRERARACVTAHGAAAVPALLELVRSGTRRERLAASRLLGSYPVGRAVHRQLVEQEVGDLERRIANVQLLRSAADGAVYGLLLSRLEEEVAEHVRAVLRLLYAESGDETLLRIERQLWSHDRRLRAAAVEALREATRREPTARRFRELVDVATDAALPFRAERGGSAGANATTAGGHRDGRAPSPRALLGTTGAPGATTDPIDDLLRRSAADPNWVTRLIACHTIGLADRKSLEDVLVDFAMDPRAALRTEAEAAFERLNGRTTHEGAPMTIVERMLLLKETELFRNLEARDLAGIASVAREVDYAAGETIMKEGDRGDFLAIIAAGTISVVKNDDKGGQFLIRQMGRPEAVGEIALLEEGPRSASIVADEPVKALLLFRAEFEALIEEYPGVALGIARVLSRRLATQTALAARR